MTGTLTTLGGGRKTYEFDTEDPDSIAQCERIWNQTVVEDAQQAFDTTDTAQGGVRLDRSVFDPSVKDQTIVPRFAGG